MKHSDPTPLGTLRADHPPAARSRGFAPALQSPCRSLVAGTLLRTEGGSVPIESLMPGALLVTADHGLRPLRRILRRRMGGRGNATPVLISAGTFGTSRDLRLSQDHRILLSDPRATALPGPAGVLAEARHLLNGTTVRLHPCAGVDYIQLIFDQPELIFAEDLLIETSHPDPYHGIGTLRPTATTADLLAMMPDLIRP